MMNVSKTRINVAVSIFLPAILFLVSCKKNELGGKSVVSGTVKHHSKVISGATIFIKFGAKDFPGSDTLTYDSKVSCDASGNFKIDDFYKGDYYLYAVGKDYAIPYPYFVKGGITVTLRNNEKLNRDIAVTEGD